MTPTARKPTWGQMQYPYGKRVPKTGLCPACGKLGTFREPVERDGKTVTFVKHGELIRPGGATVQLLGCEVTT